MTIVQLDNFDKPLQQLAEPTQVYGHQYIPTGLTDKKNKHGFSDTNRQHSQLHTGVHYPEVRNCIKTTVKAIMVGISLLVSLMMDSDDEDQSEDEMCEIDCDDYVDGDDLFAF
ncbi:hypothetical protein CAPTEDRAFT_194750 [Capitella teleta]|uniref:Uncharacterized protein n=1 Tax=Capitella teleta TaxID=283909 RepID=R7VIZ2_CAPTE|nr:hypothetical protein CAPTEDRAFT_194750 [Capitella teleta]|eukprot:ELU16261.1 hypothetical protein CAPTEDRAFT_194750 [Capitella teleta]